MINPYFFVKASRKASRFIARDLVEASSISNTSQNFSKFIEKCILRTKDILTSEMYGVQEIHFYYDDDFINNDQESLAMQEKINLEKSGKYVFVNPIQGIYNFINSIEFFGMVLMYIEISDSEILDYSIVIDFPALSRIITCQTNQGVYVEDDSEIKRKVRIKSGKRSDIIFGSNTESDFINGNLAFRREKLSLKSSSVESQRYGSITLQHRNFGCDAYHILSLIENRCNMVKFSNPNFITKLMIRSLSSELDLKIKEKNDDLLLFT